MSDKNLEQQINIKFCVKIGESASETLAILTVACGEYDMKKWRFRMAQAVEGRARCAKRPKWAAKNAKDRSKCGQSTNFGALRSKVRCETNSRRVEYE
jgi:hypothetical protein